MVGGGEPKIFIEDLLHASCIDSLLTLFSLHILFIIHNAMLNTVIKTASDTSTACLSRSIEFCLGFQDKLSCFLRTSVVLDSTLLIAILLSV